MQLLKERTALLSALLIQFHQLRLSGLGCLPLFVLLLPPGHLHKHPGGWATHDFGDLPHNGHGLVNAPLDAGRGVTLRQILLQGLAVFRLLALAVLLHLLGKGIPPAEQLHQIFIAVPQQIHDGERLPGVLVHMEQLGEKLSGQPAPTGAFHTQHLLLFLGGEFVPICLVQPAPQQLLILPKQHFIADDLFHHLRSAVTAQQPAKLPPGG